MEQKLKISVRRHWGFYLFAAYLSIIPGFSFAETMECHSTGLAAFCQMDCCAQKDPLADCHETKPANCCFHQEEAKTTAALWKSNLFEEKSVPFATYSPNDRGVSLTSGLSYRPRIPGQAGIPIYLLKQSFRC